MNKILDHVKEISIAEVGLSVLLLCIYLFGIEYFSPPGINQTFAIRMQTVIYYIAVVFLLLPSLSYFIFKNVTKYKFRKLEYRKLSDFLLLFLPLTPIVQYIILNQDTLTLYGSLYVLIIPLIISILIVILIPIILSVFAPRVLLMIIGLTLIFLFFYMPILALDNGWHKAGSLRIQLPIFTIILITLFLFYKINDKYLKIAILVFFISNSLTVIMNLTKVPLIGNSKNNSILSAFTKDNFVDKPDVYLLTYDAYVVNETMLGYGIDNSAQEQYLEKKGFKIYKDVYSIAGGTWSTMARVLNMSAQYPGRNSQVIAGKSNVHQILRNQGYTLGGVMLSEVFWEKKAPVLDFYYPSFVEGDNIIANFHAHNGHNIIVNSILEGEFDFNASAKYGKRSKKLFDSMKREFMSSPSHPKFLYTHTGPSHSQNSGKCRPNEVALFEKRLIRSNKEMKEDIKTIEKNNPDALIIINGDHGPYLTANCTSITNGMSKDYVSRLDVQDRFGTFLAIKWPKSIVPIDDNMTVLQDLFPSIFATLLRNKKILEDNVIPANTVAVEHNIITAGVQVKEGIIYGGINNGEPLFVK